MRGIRALVACASKPIYLSIGGLLSGSGTSVTRNTECVRFQRRTPNAFQADQSLRGATVDRGRHAPMMPIPIDRLTSLIHQPGVGLACQDLARRECSLEMAGELHADLYAETEARL